MLRITHPATYFVMNSDTAAIEYSDGQLKSFLAIGIVELILFILLFAFAVYNTIFFLCRQKRYRIYFITVFYALSYIVIIIRIALAALLISYYVNIEELRNDQHKANSATVLFLGLEIVATYAKICLGFFQVAAIIILTLQVK